MAFNWNFRRQPDLTNYIGVQIDPYNASRIASENMQGYRPNTTFTPGTPAEQAAAAMQGYTQNPLGGQFSVPNDMHGGMGQPDIEGYDESLQAASDAAAQAQAREQQITDIQSQIKALQTHIAENQAKLKNWNGGDVANKVAALEARKFFSQDPTSIWRWKQDKDYATQLAAKQNGTDSTAKANAMIEIANDLDSIIVDDKMTSQDQKAYLSKLSNMKTLGEKAGVPKSVIDSINAKIAEVKGENKTENKKVPEGSEYEGTSRDQWDNEAKELLNKPNLTSGDITKFKQKNPNISNEVRQELKKKHSELIDHDNKVKLNKRYDAARQKAGIDKSTWALLSNAKKKEILDNSGL